jgi:hypothetical protein
MVRAAFILLGLMVAQCPAAPSTAPARISDEGRILYANDDDWDWASPLGAKEPCALSTYGKMDWSALDWIEEGLDAVNCFCMGTLPDAYLSLEQLSQTRHHGDRSYSYLLHEPGTLAKILGGRAPPQAVLLMRNCTGEFEADFTEQDLAALASLVQHGGRLIILDDWGIYAKVIDRFLKDAPLVAAPPAAGELENRVTALATRLGDDDFAVRENATEQLIAMGKEILPLLEKIRSDDPEVNNRIRHIRAGLTRPPPSHDQSSSLSNQDMEGLLARVRQRYPQAALRDMKRNGSGEPGKALVIRVPATNPAR